MEKCNGMFLCSLFVTVVASMSFSAAFHVVVSADAGSSAASAYQEVERDGRLYVFSSVEGKTAFEKLGEIGKGIIKIGHGPDGKTVVFDSDEAVKEYDKCHSEKMNRLLK